MNPLPETRHVPDEDILLVQEGWADPDLTETVREHLRGCAECARRAEWLRRRTSILDSRLAELVPPAGRLPSSFVEGASRTVPRRSGGGWRIVARSGAAVVAALVAAMALVGPLRALALDWAAARWSDAVGLFERGPRATHELTLRKPAPVSVPTEYRFIPEGSELRLELASTQPRGTVTVTAVQDVAAVLEVDDGVEGESRAPVLVLPDRVRIGNSVESTASYSLAVPSQLRALRVRVGDGPWSTLRPGEFWPGEQRVLPLGASE